MLRAMFACWAPKEIPEWFLPYDDTEFIPELPKWQDLPKDIREHARQWVDDCLDDLDGDARLVKFKQDFNAAIDANDARFQSNTVGRYFSWRWFYADQMLEWRLR